MAVSKARSATGAGSGETLVHHVASGRFMRYPHGHKEKTRARIVEAAGRVFRREGYHAAGIDQVMAEAGLTAGGFYAHFASKEALLSEALEHAAAELNGRHERALDSLSERDWASRRSSAVTLGPLTAIGFEEGCPLAAPVSEVDALGPARQEMLRGDGPGTGRAPRGQRRGRPRTRAGACACGGCRLRRRTRTRAFGRRSSACRGDPRIVPEPGSGASLRPARFVSAEDAAAKEEEHVTVSLPPRRPR